MKFRKPIILIMVLVCTLAFFGCKSKNDSSRALWDKFVSNVNNHNHEGIASCFYPTTASSYTMFISNEENFEQYDRLSSIKTVSFELTTSSDLSSTSVTQLYDSAKVSVEVIEDGASYDLEFDVYMSKTNINPWLFTSVVNIDPILDSKDLGNLPDDLWLRNALHTYEDYEYRKAYKIENEGINYSTVSIIRYNGKGGEVVIPDEIEGLPVTVIKKFAFAKFGKIFQITYPGSKVTKLTIGKNVTQIEDYAFFQSKKLREVVIPSNVTSIGEYAFSSSKRLNTIRFYVNDNDLYTEEFLKEIASTSSFDISILGARNMYVGDIIRLQEGQGRLVTWSVSSSNVASIDADRGTVTALASGSLTITCSLKEDPTIKATVTINVTPCPERMKVQSSAFERCRNLKEIYVYAINPNSFSIAGTSFRFPDDAKIYVPKGSLAMYLASSNWKPYSENIYEME